tara:strand:+ start:301 stop:537 length:237 start_codon:yes stop_codon:yes gene_type:complete
MRNSYINDYTFVRSWIIICNTGDLLVKCSKKELLNILLDIQKDSDYKIIDYFEYKSDEYWMFKEGKNYDVNKNYAINR